jgi:hypothetical protein
MVRDAALYSPSLIPLLYKDSSYDSKITTSILHSLIPRRTSLEIECTGSVYHHWNEYKRLEPLFNLKEFDSDNIWTKSCFINENEYETHTKLTFNEHRISLYNYKSLLGLYNLLEIMKQECCINENGAVHIHVNFPIKLKFIDKQNNIIFIKNLLRNQLDYVENIFGKYKGRYNDKNVYYNTKGAWICIRVKSHDLTIEFRIGKCTFDYTTLVKQMIGCNKIVTNVLQNKDLIKLMREYDNNNR